MVTPKYLRQHQTDAEQALWHHLRARRLQGFKFRRQHSLGIYIVDFICLDSGLIVEVDGGQHDERAGKDAKRTAWLEVQGFTVLRFWDNEVLKEMDGVLQAIELALTSPSPQSSPIKGEEVLG